MPSKPVAVDAETQRAIEALIYEHAWLVDHGQADRIHELYTEDAKLIGIGPDRVGRAAIAAYGKERAKLTKRVTRHIYSNIRLVAVDRDTITGTVAGILFRSDGDAIGHPLPIAIGEFDDVYVREPDGSWKIAERRLSVIFESPEHRA